MNVQLSRRRLLGAPGPDELAEPFAGTLLGESVRHGPMLGYTHQTSQAQNWAVPNFFSATRGLMPRVVASPAEILRKSVKAWIDAKPRGEQAYIAKEIAKVHPSTFSAFKAGRHGLGTDSMREVASYIGLPVTELFPERETSSTNGLDVTEGKDVNSPPPLSLVTLDASSITTLRQQLLDLQTQHDKLLSDHDKLIKDIAGTVDYFGSIVAEQAAPPKKAKPRPRRPRGTHA